MTVANLSRLAAVLCEDAIYALAAGSGDPAGTLEGLGKRRADLYTRVSGGGESPRMIEQYETWLIQLTHAIAPVAPPVWIPMMEVVKEKVTLEIGARGLRSLFSTKPSEKDVARVKRYGTLATRVLRATLAADGALDQEEQTILAAVISAFGLPEQDAQALFQEQPIAHDKLDIGIELEAGVVHAIVHGAWLAAGWDMIDPREELYVRSIAHRMGMMTQDIEQARASAQMRVEGRRLAGLAAVDGIRYVLSDRVPGMGVQLPAIAGTLLLPRRYREEALAPIGHGAPVTLGKRYTTLAAEERSGVLGLVWAAAVLEDPPLSRRALLRARWERFAEDLSGDGRMRHIVDEWMDETLTGVARSLP
jgi:hypothetical protein